MGPIFVCVPPNKTIVKYTAAHTHTLELNGGACLNHNPLTAVKELKDIIGALVVDDDEDIVVFVDVDVFIDAFVVIVDNLTGCHRHLHWLSPIPSLAVTDTFTCCHWPPTQRR